MSTAIRSGAAAEPSAAGVRWRCEAVVHDGGDVAGIIEWSDGEVGEDVLGLEPVGLGAPEWAEGVRGDDLVGMLGERPQVWMSWIQLGR